MTRVYGASALASGGDLSLEKRLVMNIQRLAPTWAPAYRQLMLEAYARHPEAFTSSPEERAALPLHWWERRLQEDDQAQERVWGATCGGNLLGVVGLGLETREKVRHKATLFGLYVPDRHRRLGRESRRACWTNCWPTRRGWPGSGSFSSR